VLLCAADGQEEDLILLDPFLDLGVGHISEFSYQAIQNEVRTLFKLNQKDWRDAPQSTGLVHVNQWTDQKRKSIEKTLYVEFHRKNFYEARKQGCIGDWFWHRDRKRNCSKLRQ
jgi:hypothetical protein